MVLEGCAEQHLGCCILLRGAPLQELIRVKKVVKFMLLACYNWKLEKALLGDIEAILPEPGMTFIDDDNNDNDNVDINDGTVKNDKTDETKCNVNEGIDSINNDKSKDTNAGKVASNDETERNNEYIDNETAKSTEEVNKPKDTNADDGSHNDKTAVANELIDSEKPDEINKPMNVETNPDPGERNNESPRNNDDARTSKDQEIDDASQKTKPFVRKADSDKNLSCGVPIRDFSDPLRATLSVDDDVFLPKEETKLKADNHSDRWSTDDVVLSISPNVVIPAPYLETEAGRRCPLRRYFPRPLLTVPTRPPHTPRTYHRRISRPQQNDLVLKEVHPFIKNPITSSAEDPALKASLAHYRATGCRLVNNNHTHNCPLYKPSVVKKSLKEPEVEASEKQNESNEPLDPLAPENHQRLSLLLYSYSNKSTNVPDFCVNPWIVTMEMYGRHDISLGGFLQKYCFNGDYKCPSNNCQVPMNQHVRRFVHGDVCITITCNTVGHSSVDKVKEEQCRQVRFWSRCESCGRGASGAGGASGEGGEGARGRRVGARALGVSLAQYVRLRCGAARLLRRGGCRHPLHKHAHAFACRLTTACFRYSKVSTYDIELPPEVISINYDTKQMRDTLIVQLNELMLKGHETYSSLTDSDAEKDYQTFKQHMDQIHLALTSSSLQEQTTLAAVVRSLWSVSDRIISGEKMLRDAQEKWSSPPAKPTKQQPENTVEEKPELEEPAGEGSNDSSDPANKDSEKEHAGTEEDEEKGDKKTVKQILSQLLSNNQPSNQSGMIISSGLVPVVVMAGEIGSVIAATLASVTYQRTLRAQRHSNQNEQDDNDSTNATARDKAESDKSKPAKSNDHIEVLLKDGLVCRVYYAAQFQRLRHMLLAPLGRGPRDDDDDDDDDARCGCDDAREKNENKSLCEIEEGFIRSLALCVPWAARGGKSGSTFCKTKDDRYVLKEMTKPEWQQFLEFAPHYFNYVTNCHQNKLPSLLARILGVYSVGGAGNGVLVMENVWYGCGARARRFDLKGSSRHRLTPDSPARPLAVLMDENLLNLRWETQLYVQSHTGSVIWSCVERDTEFLSANSVMDYSLLLGIDNQKLVLGVIDYIRTFTWDKKLEHLVKKNLGSGQPTVVSPEQYKRRFCTACHKYFLQCPTHWDHLYTTSLV